MEADTVLQAALLVVLPQAVGVISMVHDRHADFYIGPCRKP